MNKGKSQRLANDRNLWIPFKGSRCATKDDVSLFFLPYNSDTLGLGVKADKHPLFGESHA
jgi:hypothetical protein